jgi:hypothetical protein
MNMAVGHAARLTTAQPMLGDSVSRHGSANRSLYAATRLISGLVCTILLAFAALAFIPPTYAAPGSAVAPIGPGARLALPGTVVHPEATQNPGTGMSTDFDWATLVLEDGGWPTSSNNITVITQWMASENCIPTTSTCSYPWWNRNNPLNNGLGSGGGDGTGSYSSLVVAAYYVALNLEASNYGYPQIAADLAASDTPSVTATAIQDSDWAASHYGYGSGWHSSAVESIAAPASSWGNGGGSGPPMTNGSFVRTPNGSIYVVAGGAAIHVDNCAPLGGCPGVVELPNLAGYATEPATGTFLRVADGADEGLVARVIGGVPLGLTTCEGMEGEGCTTPVNIDSGGLSEYAASHRVIANGTFVRVADGPKAGLIGRVVGGVLLGLLTCEGMEGEGCNTAVNVAENAYTYYANEYHTIANGTFVRVADGPKAGLVGRVVGGVLLGLITCEGMESEGCNTAVNVAENAYTYYASEFNTIANGTFVRVADGPKARLIGRVVGGVLLGLLTCEGMEDEGCNSAVNVAENAYDYYANEYHTIANGTFVRVADGPKAGLIGRVAGGVLLGLITCEGMESEGCNSAVNVAENAYDYYASEFNTIANGTFVRVADGPLAGLVARAAGGALLGLTTCVPLEECPGQINVAENAFTYYTAEHPEPANGTILEGLPSGSYWSINNGERVPESASTEAVAVDDAIIASFTLRTPPTAGGATIDAPTSTNTSDIPSGNQAKTSSPSHGVLGTKTTKPSKSASALSRALAKCRKIKNTRKRSQCILAARKVYGHRHSRRAPRSKARR